MAITVTNIGHSPLYIDNKVISPGQSMSTAGLTNYIQALVSGGVLYVGSSYTYPTAPTPSASVASNAQNIIFSPNLNITPTFTDGSIIIQAITSSFTLNFAGGSLGQKVRLLMTSNAASATLTWGPNVKTGASTCSVGGVGTSCVWSFIYNGSFWIGDNATAAGPLWK